MRKTIGKLTLITILISGLVVCFLALIAYNVKDIVFGTPFTVNAPADGTTLTSTFVPITGNTTRAQQITINGRSIGVAPDGSFSDSDLLSIGYNIVEVAETNRFGRTKTVAYHWVVAPSVAVAQNDVSPYQR